MVTCPHCGKETPGGKFCEQCGGTLPVSPYPVTTSAAPSTPAPANIWIMVAATAVIVVLFIFGLVSLLGGMPVPVLVLFTPPAPWEGTWDTTFGIMTLTQSGDFVMGSYSFQDGVITGTVSGRTLTGTWSEGPTYEPPDQAGDVILTISGNGTAISGKWRFGTSGDWAGEWSAVKISPE